ncbi:MAG: hypothetical protein AAF919_05140 [Pseudomonadota bacterium]
MDRALLLLVAAFFVLLYPMLKDGLHGRPVPVLVDTAALPNMPAPAVAGAPAQLPIKAKKVSLGHDKTATLTHRYVIEGAVLVTGRYSLSGHADISPLDLGIVTGPMAAPEYTRHMQATNGRRVSYLSWDKTALPDEVTGDADWFTNNHIIPSTDALRDALLAIEEGQHVRIEGYLVDVQAPGMLGWNSSEKRDDVWCEIILVTGFSILGEATAKEV